MQSMHTNELHRWAAVTLKAMLARIFAGLAAQLEADARELRAAARGVL